MDFFPALDVPAFSKDKTGFLVALSDSNVFGSGDSGRIRYEQIREEGEDPRHLISGLYRIFRLFDSHWEFDGVYTQKKEGVSWEASLKRPLYSLQTRWSAAFTAAESADEVRWYQQGEKTAVFERNSQSESGQIVRSFGDRRRQTQVALWMISERAYSMRLRGCHPPLLTFRTEHKADWDFTRSQKSQLYPHTLSQ